MTAELLSASDDLVGRFFFSEFGFPPNCWDLQHSHQFSSLASAWIVHRIRDIYCWLFKGVDIMAVLNLRMYEVASLVLVSCRRSSLAYFKVCIRFIDSQKFSSIFWTLKHTKVKGILTRRYGTRNTEKHLKLELSKCKNQRTFSWIDLRELHPLWWIICVSLQVQQTPWFYVIVLKAPWFHLSVKSNPTSTLKVYHSFTTVINMPLELP